MEPRGFKFFKSPIFDTAGANPNSILYCRYEQWGIDAKRDEII